ncbi:MAG: TonB family protein [Dysgonamonadaceae bacterium]|jgi:TonB family protein|nr:TonB family protein [Dysgonamonadaceae bacterium]
MNEIRERIIGYSGSAVFCLLIFLLLWFTVIKTTVNKQEIGIPLIFETELPGASAARLGQSEEQPAPAPAAEKPVPQPEVKKAVQKPVVKQTAKTASKPVAKPAITQNTEKTAAISQAEQERQREQQRQAAEAARQKEINQQIAGALSGKSTGSGSTTGTSTNSGTPAGSASGNASTGSGGTSWGGTWDLGGRSPVGGLPRPDYASQTEGKIVLNITVNPAGSVIFAEIGRGTTIDNATMRASALAAAKRAKFESVSGSNNQSGTITYRYYLK